MKMVPRLLTVAILASLLHLCTGANILMITLGGTKSHKIPFWELARGLVPRGHNITFLNGFSADFHMVGLEEITPDSLVYFIKNFTNWDLLGARMRGEPPVAFDDMVYYAYKACDMMLDDSETQDLLQSGQEFDLIILDGAFPECSVAIAHYYKKPFMYINTVGLYMGSLSQAGNPTTYSITPFFGRGFTNSMGLIDRFLNTGWNMMGNILHKVTIQVFLDNVLKKHFGSDIPPAYEMIRNVSFILQNSHATLTYPQPYLPNVAEVACIHCKPAKPLPKDLENFINEGKDAGFIYVSMGSSVKADNMPEYLRRMLVRVFEQLPYQVLWKWESPMIDIPDNVKLSRWLPQQDILGHPKIRAFITHGGLLSMFETVYHGVPVVTLPVFCDHDANAAKAELDGYALKLELQTLTAETLLAAVKHIIHNPKYRIEVKRRQQLLKDQNETPLERAIYWTEYVLRHKGAEHLLSPARNLHVLQYYLVDVFAIYLALSVLFLLALYHTMKLAWNLLIGNISINVYHSKMKEKLQ